MSFLKIFGSFCLLIFAFLTAKIYRTMREGALDRLEGIVLFLRFVKEEIGSYLTPCDAIYRKFRHEGLEACGFLPLLREKNSLSEALALSRERLDFPTDVFGVMTAYAKTLGQGFREEEIERAERVLSILDPTLAAARETVKKEVRLSRVLLFSGALLLILWLL